MSHRTHSMTRWFPATEQAVPQARDWAVEMAAATGHAEASPTVRLLVSELATNAIRHTDGERFLVEFDADSMIVVAVCDSSLGEPRIRRAADTETGGRGLGIVDKLADQWGVALSKRGKCVWFRLDE